MLALVFGLLAALIQGVFAFVGTSRVARTVVDGQAGDAGSLDPAILTVVVHSLPLINGPARLRQ